MTTHTVVRTNPTEFKGYSVDLLRGLKGLGPALVDDADLYAAAVEYNDSASPGAAGSLGPALLTADCNTVVVSSTAHVAPEMIVAKGNAAAEKPSRSESSDDPWAEYDLGDLMALVKKHGVDVPGRVKTPGKLIAALEAAGVAP